MEEEDYLPYEIAFPEEDLNILYTWSYEDAVKAQKTWVDSRTDPPCLESINMSKEEYFQTISCPLNAWKKAQELVKLADRYEETGEKGIILEGLHICADYGFVMPRWLSDAFAYAYADVIYKKFTSWDDVFGKPHPKRTHANDERIRERDAHKIFQRIKKIIKTEKCPIDAQLYERVGRELGIGGKTKVSELYKIAKVWERNQTAGSLKKSLSEEELLEVFVRWIKTKNGNQPKTAK